MEVHLDARPWRQRAGCAVQVGPRRCRNDGGRGGREAGPAVAGSTMSGRIDVDQLRVGMYIHLDLGWMQHPFPVGSFRISHAQQIAKIRGLGLRQLRWSPEKSDAGALRPHEH